MRVRPEELAGHLRRGLAPLYLVGGDEPLQAEEAVDAICAAATEAGFDERERFEVEAGFDWNRVLEAAHSPSLFATRRILDVRLNTGPGDAGGRALATLAERPADDTLVLLRCGRLDANTQKTRWFRRIEEAGVVVRTWMPSPHRLKRWVVDRARSRGVRLSDAAAALLAERSEGNLLAAAQEIDKLRLWAGDGDVDEAAALRALTDAARFTVFDLADAAVAGDVGRCVRVLDGLRGEGTAPALLLWALAQDARLLANLAWEARQGGGPAAALKRVRVRQARVEPLRRALLAAPDPAAWQGVLVACARADGVVKGAVPGDAWAELLQLTTRLAETAAGRPTRQWKEA